MGLGSIIIMGGAGADIGYTSGGEENAGVI
jgi:hypothetical protein